jgi:hypothetical protein
MWSEIRCGLIWSGGRKTGVTVRCGGGPRRWPPSEAALALADSSNAELDRTCEPAAQRVGTGSVTRVRRARPTFWRSGLDGRSRPADRLGVYAQSSRSPEKAAGMTEKTPVPFSGRLKTESMSKGGAHTAGSFSLWGLRDAAFRRAIPVRSTPTSIQYCTRYLHSRPCSTPCASTWRIRPRRIKTA